MKRSLLTIALLLAADSALAGGAFGTKENIQLGRIFAYGGNFGFPAYAADPFVCTATTIRTTYYNTVSNAPKFCNGTSWLSLSPSAPTSPIAGDIVATGKWTFGTAADAANTVRTGDVAGGIVFEGATANGFETVLDATDATVGDTTLHLPNLGAATSDTLAGLVATQTFTSKTFVWGSTNDNTASTLQFSTAQTPDSGLITTGSTSNAIHVMETADVASDFSNGACGTVACTSPSIILRSHNAGTAAQYQNVVYWGSAGRFTKALTESSLTTTIRVPVASGAGTGGKLCYTVFATDATDHQTRSGCVTFSVVNKAGTETCAVYGVDAAFTANPIETQDGSGAGTMSAGTLTYTWGVSTAATNACDLQLNAVSSLSQTSLDFYGRMELVGPGEPMPQ